MHTDSKRKLSIYTLPSCLVLQAFLNCAILCEIQCEPEEHLFLKKVFIKGAMFLLLKIVFIYLQFRLSMNIDLIAFPTLPVCLRPP